MTNIELYVHRTTFYLSVKLFVSHNELIHLSCNIDTASNLRFIKSPRSELKKCFGKLIAPLDFIQLQAIVVLVWNEWFSCIHNIWVWNGKTSLFLFCSFIFPNTSPIILLLRSCHLFCINIAFYLQSNDIILPMHVELCWNIIRTTCYQAIPLVTCWMNSWWRLPSTIYFLPFFIGNK